MRAWAALLTGLFLSFPVAAAATASASPARVEAAADALFRSAAEAASTDPSCSGSPLEPGATSVASALARYVARAGEDGSPVGLKLQCGSASQRPLETGEERCTLLFEPEMDESGDVSPFGLAFVMDWPRNAVRPGSVECIE